jgi:hypothetical protein
MGKLWALIAAGVLVGASSAGAAVVVPNANATAGGDAQGPAPFPFYSSTGSHDQVVYAAAQFGAFNGAESISGIQFRPFPGSGASAFSAGTFSISNVTITLSTTPASEQGATMLSTSYASNVGADSKVVYSGPLTLTTTTTTAPDGTTKIFDYSIPLQSSFTYNPALGNLLLDVNIPAGATVSGGGFGFVTFDEVNDNGDGVASVVTGNGALGSAGIYSTAAPITQFTFGAVPEPASASIAGLGIGAVLLRRRHK